MTEAELMQELADRANALGVKIDVNINCFSRSSGTRVGSMQISELSDRTLTRRGGPGLLAVDDVLPIDAFRRGFERGEIGAGAGLGEALAPPVVEIGDAGEEALLLRVAAEGDDHRADHGDAEAERRRRWRLLQFLEENVMLGRGPVAAAPFGRPVRYRPALGVENALPDDEVV